jgi:hypothetical protein
MLIAMIAKEKNSTRKRGGCSEAAELKMSAGRQLGGREGGNEGEREAEKGRVIRGKN